MSYFDARKTKVINLNIKAQELITERIRHKRALIKIAKEIRKEFNLLTPLEKRHPRGVRECAMCKETREIKGLSLCGPCYHRARRSEYRNDPVLKELAHVLHDITRTISGEDR